MLIMTAKNGINFNYETNQFEGITQDRIVRWTEAFPAVDIELGLKQATLWVIDNPKKRKSRWGRFLTNWFSRRQEKGGDQVYKRKMRLLPITGRVCSKESCRLPAVYKDPKSGAYDIYYCIKHLPAEVKEFYE